MQSNDGSVNNMQCQKCDVDVDEKDDVICSHLVLCKKCYEHMNAAEQMRYHLVIGVCMHCVVENNDYFPESEDMTIKQRIDVEREASALGQYEGMHNCFLKSLKKVEVDGEYLKAGEYDDSNFRDSIVAAYVRGVNYGIEDKKKMYVIDSNDSIQFLFDILDRERKNVIVISVNGRIARFALHVVNNNVVQNNHEEYDECDASEEDSVDSVG